MPPARRTRAFSSAFAGVLLLPSRGFLGYIRPTPVDEAAIAEPVSPFNLDWVCGLALYEAVIVAIVRLAPYGSPFEAPLFWVGLWFLFFPIAMRVTSISVSAGERIVLLCLLAASSFAIKLLFWPSGLSQFDEWCHWVTATEIIDSHRLFLPNSILPVSSLYPGLEVLTSGLVQLSGFPLFPVTAIVVLLARTLFISALCAFLTRILGSNRLAAMGCLGYMGSSTYVLFDSLYAYETLAVAFLALVLFLESALYAQRAGSSRTLAVLGPMLAALAITHHVTSFAMAGVLSTLALFHVLQSPRERVWPVVLTAGCAVGMALLWLGLTGDAVGGYLAPVLTLGVDQFTSMLANGGPLHHQLYVNADGTGTPVLLQAQGVTSVILTAAMLAHGFLTGLARAGDLSEGSWSGLTRLYHCHWPNPRLLLVVLLALSWPLSVGLRLVPAGWELGDRMATISYIGVGAVLAFSLMRCMSRSWPHLSVTIASAMLSMLFVGGVVSGWGVAATHIGYRVGGGGLSLEPMGLDAVRWTRVWLGAANRFFSDRVNDALLAAYGHQKILTSSQGFSSAALFTEPQVSSHLLDEIRASHADYLFVDLRLAADRTFQRGDFNSEDDGAGNGPLEPKALTKWDHVPGVDRVFDDGWIIIYDVAGLRDAS